jgi:hypothetical protein
MTKNERELQRHLNRRYEVDPYALRTVSAVQQGASTLFSIGMLIFMVGSAVAICLFDDIVNVLINTIL